MTTEHETTPDFLARPITPDEITAWRAEHVGSMYCTRCVKRMPCPLIRSLDALEAVRADTLKEAAPKFAQMMADALGELSDKLTEQTDENEALRRVVDIASSVADELFERRPLSPALAQSFKTALDALTPAEVSS